MRQKMVILPNGDKWITWEEHKQIEKQPKLDSKNFSEVSIQEFINGLMIDNAVYKYDEFNGYWKIGNNPYKEIIEGMATSIIKTPFFTVCEMPWREVFVIYDGPDMGGYDVIRKMHKFANREEYMKNVSFT